MHWTIDLEHSGQWNFEGAMQELITTRANLKSVTLIRFDTCIRQHQAFLKTIFIDLIYLESVILQDSRFRRTLSDPDAEMDGNWVDALAENTVVKELRISSTCTFFPFFIKSFVNALDKNNTIETLMLGGSLRRFGTIGLTKMLERSTNLKCLVLGSSSRRMITKYSTRPMANICSADEIVSIVGKNTGIEELYISHIPFRIEQLQQFVKTLAANTTLVTLSIACVIDTMSWVDFTGILAGLFAQNHKLTRVVLMNQDRRDCFDANTQHVLRMNHLKGTECIVQELMNSFRSRKFELRVFPRQDIVIARKLCLNIQEDLMHSVWLYWREKELAAAMALHTRLGANSCLGVLSEELLRMIFSDFL
jgi:hypothetical protein